MAYASSLQPLRPPSSISSSSSSGSIPDLADSFVIVPTSDDEAETESTSTIGTALLDEISDTSSEPHHSGSLEGSHHGDLSDAEDDLDFPGERSVGGSYADAEATASLLTDSRTTLSADIGSPNIPEFTPTPRPTMRGAGSDFRFIFPNPEASFSSSGTFTGGVTPSGSIATLPPAPQGPALDAPPGISGIGNDAPFARLSVEARQRREKSPTRGVDEAWLKDARTWAPTHVDPVAMLMPSWEKGQYETPSEVAAQPVEKVAVSGTVAAQPEGVDVGEKEERVLFFPVEERQMQLKRALRAMVAAGAGSPGNRWGLLAFASCALAILGALGPGMTYLARGDRHALLNVSSTATPLPTQAGIPLEELFTSIEIPPSSASHTHTPRPLATQLIPDSQVIKDALSTFTSEPGQADQAESQRISPACCNHAAEPSSVALSPVPQADLAVVDHGIFKAWWEKAKADLVRPSSPIIPPAPLEEMTPCNCTTSPDLHVDNHYAYLVQRTRDYAVATTSAIAQLYHPMILHLDHELQELSRLAAYIAGRNATRSAVRRMQAARLGARALSLKLADAAAHQRVVQLDRLARLTSYASSAWAGMTDTVQRRTSAEQAVLRKVVLAAQDGLGKLGEKADEVKHEGERSLRLAKKGLGNLIEAQQRSKAEAEEEGGGGMARGERRTRGRQPRFTRSRRMMRERRSREAGRLADGASLAEMQGDATVVAGKPAGETIAARKGGGATEGETTWRRLLEAVHHGAVQVVLHQ